MDPCALLSYVVPPPLAASGRVMLVLEFSADILAAESERLSLVPAMPSLPWTVDAPATIAAARVALATCAPNPRPLPC